MMLPFLHNVDIFFVMFPQPLATDLKFYQKFRLTYLRATVPLTKKCNFMATKKLVLVFN